MQGIQTKFGLTVISAHAQSSRNLVTEIVTQVDASDKETSYAQRQLPGGSAIDQAAIGDTVTFWSHTSNDDDPVLVDVKGKPHAATNKPEAHALVDLIKGLEFPGDADPAAKDNLFFARNIFAGALTMQSLSEQFPPVPKH
jgi:hypothetical protein